MSVIENFAALSAQEQREFAVELLTKINSEHIFHDDVTFELVTIETDDLTGGLWIAVSHSGEIDVTRKASWEAADEDDAENDPGHEATYSQSIYDEAKKAFKTLSTVIDGYTVSLEIHDVDEGDTVEVEVDHISHEDAGIGQYEYWGEIGYDSRPYVEVEGTIVKACDCTLAFSIEAAESVPEEN